MSKLKDIKTVYFLGIGGIGMSGLSTIFLSFMDPMCLVMTRPRTPLTRQLENEGIRVHYTPSPESVPVNADLIIYNPSYSCRPSRMGRYSFD